VILVIARGERCAGRSERRAGGSGTRLRSAAGAAADLSVVNVAQGLCEPTSGSDVGN